MFILLFSIHLEWLPFIYNSSIEATGFAWALEHLRQGAMPIAVLGLFQAAFLTRFVRASLLEIINQDFVNTARAKGLHERYVILKHALRNALIPVATVIAYQIPGIFTGALITEQIFRVNGLGQLLITAIQGGDVPLAQTLTFVFAVFVVIFNIIADLLYAVLDPRIRYD